MPVELEFVAVLGSRPDAGTYFVMNRRDSLVFDENFDVVALLDASGSLAKIHDSGAGLSGMSKNAKS